MACAKCWEIAIAGGPKDCSDCCQKPERTCGNCAVGHVHKCDRCQGYLFCADGESKEPNEPACDSWKEKQQP